MIKVSFVCYGNMHNFIAPSTSYPRGDEHEGRAGEAAA